MQGDFSVLNFDPRLHERGVAAPADGVLRNLSGVLHQQGRVMSDADLTEGELLELGWNGQAGRDIIGAGICAVPATEPDGFKVEAAAVVGGQVHVSLRPGRAWADGILTRLAGAAADPLAPVTRLATYYGPPLTTPEPLPDSIGDGVRDAVILEVSEEALHGFQYPERLVEPALGGPDTAGRAYVNYRLRLLRLGPNEDCVSIRTRLREDPATLGRLTATLTPAVPALGDCPVTGGGGYTGFEHHLVRVEIADVAAGAPPRFKWSQWNGALVGRGRFDATTSPDRVIIDAGRAPIVHSGLTEFYLEALQYDALLGGWTVVYATMATLNTDHDLELAAPPSFGTLPATTDPVFFRLWNGIADIAAFTATAPPAHLHDGIHLAFDAPAAGNYRPGDYWTFTVRAGELPNPEVLLDHAPPVGIVHHRVPLAEIGWTGRRDTSVSGTIEDCRVPFGALTRKTCCTFLIGDGVTSFGDFNSLEQAAAHLPAGGGELCLLPGLHRANLRLQGRRNVTIHGCAHRTLVLPHTKTRMLPVLHFVDCTGIRVHTVDLLTYDGIAVLVDRSRDVRIDGTRMIARLHCIRANDAAGLHVAGNRLHLLDTAAGLATISLAADDSLVERNTVALLPFVDRTPNDPDVPDDDPTRDPADPCARPEILYLYPHLVMAYANLVWTFVLTLLVPQQPYRALGGIHLRAGCERVRLLENDVVGGAGNGVVLGGDLDPPQPPPAEPPDDDDAGVPVDVGQRGAFIAEVRNEAGAPQAGIDLYLEAADGSMATGRTDAAGRVAIKAAIGRHQLTVAPAWRIVSVSQLGEGQQYLVVIAPRGQGGQRDEGFLHEITIEANRITLMGLSGIGFAPRRGANLAGATGVPAGLGPKETLLAYIDAALVALALTPLLRATHPVLDLVILNNRLQRNLRNPFTERMLAEAQQIGRGGISLAIVGTAAIRGNHILENGVNAADPACGVFVGWGNDVEITDNTLAANGALKEGYEENRRAGLRGGIYLRFAAALTLRLSASSGRKAALRVHDNRVDQPAGRALTAFAFGPLSIANNHFSSEHTGRHGMLDAAFGCVLVLNFGGIHRLLARQLADQFDNAHDYQLAADLALPGGETLYNDNFARVDEVNRSVVAQALLCFDDLSCANGTSSVLRGDPLFCNTMLLADTLRATGNRLREDATRTLSMLSMALRGNITTLNQGDHCIFAFPASTGGHQPRTVDAPNHVFDTTFCGNAAGGQATLGAFAAPALSAHAGQLGGTIEADTFSATEMPALARRHAGVALARVTHTQVALARAWQAEALRLEAKLGAGHPRTVALKAQAEAAVAAQRSLAQSADALTGKRDEPEDGARVEGRVVDASGAGQADHTVELLDPNHKPVAQLGGTDAKGAFGKTFDTGETTRLAQLGKLLPRVLNRAGQQVLLSEDGIALAPGARIELTLVLPQRGPVGRAAGARTPLDQLDIEAPLREQLHNGGIEDAEGILKAEPELLARLAGDVATAQRLIQIARALLG